MSGKPEILISEQVGQQEWDAFVAAHPEATGYHQWAWRGVFEAAFGHETCYLAARRQNTLVGILPLVAFRSWLFGRFMVSLPFVNYGPWIRWPPAFPILSPPVLKLAVPSPMPW
jgi:serine/alanine adding enzyme